MAQTPRELTPDRSARDRFGAQLRHWRVQRGLSQVRLAERVHFSGDLIAKVEKAERWPNSTLAEACDRALDTGGVLAGMWPAVDAERQQAARIARRRFADDRIAAGKDHPGTDGAVRLAASDGDRLGLARHWIGMLRVLAESHNMFGRQHIHQVVCGESAVIRQYRRGASDAIKAALLAVEARWAEFGSWTADCLGRQQEAVYWLDRSATLAHRAGDPLLAAYVGMRRAQQAAERGDAQAAIALADRAGRTRELSERDRALCALREAHGHALSGEGRDCATAIDRAYQLVSRAEDRSDGDDPGTIGRHCVPAYVQAHEGYCSFCLGKPGTAVAILSDALAGWPVDFRQDEGLARGWLALSYAATNQPDRAGAEGSRALRLATDGGAARTLRVLQQLNDLLPTAGAAEVAEFHAAYSVAATAFRM